MTDECYCDRCTGDPPCSVTGDHRYGKGATCKDCGQFNGALLQWLRFEKAEREGRAHVDHFHKTNETAESCRHKAGRYPESEEMEIANI